ncbi:hypothetical protein LTR53_005095 [Teratosphaeriaceae sp. CCFEE 6253]|nr:hypothetical protein LTR53_005095 [Teratosphaeriaceae sp. CCFEE 6253]
MFLRAVLGSFVCLTTIIHASPIGGVIEDAGPHNALQQRNILVPGYLIPVTTVDADVVAGTPATASRERVPTGTIAVVKRAVTSMPNLVPTSQVDLATDTVGTQIVSPLFVPTVVADIGVATPGCAVYISDYSYITQSNVDWARKLLWRAGLAASLQRCWDSTDGAGCLDLHFRKYDMRWGQHSDDYVDVRIV